jgi:type IV pilus assembly protein PilC
MLKSPEQKKREHGSLFTFGLSKERDFFLENISMLVGSGMPVLDAIDATNAGLKLKRMKELVAEIRQDIDGGSTFSSAFASTGLFSDHAISLIRIGEASGKLKENLKMVAQEQEKDRVLKSKLRSAMMYPVFVLGLTLFVGVGIAWFILPKLATVFTQMKLKLPLLTSIFINAGIFLGKYGSIVVPIFFVILFAIYYFLFVFPATKTYGQKLLFKIPGIKDLMKEVEVSRFGYLMGALLTAGLPIDEALNSMAKASVLDRYRDLYNYLLVSISEGITFKKAFATYPDAGSLIPDSMQQLIVAGERSGSLPETFVRIGETYEAKTEITTRNLTIILEPILLIIIWLGVVCLALAVILPIYNLVGQMNP